MRTSSLLKLLVGAVVVCLSGCACGPPEPALRVVITVDKEVPGTCVVLEVSSGGTVRLTQELKRPKDKNVFRVGIKKLQLPTDLQLVARSYTSTTGACAEPRAQTSVSAQVAASFPKSDVTTVNVDIHLAPADLDADRDGHIAVAKGGDDCNDNDVAVHPGLPALCGSAFDNDCDGAIGCLDSECAGAAICNAPPAGLAFVTTAAPVNVNACSPALTVEIRDANQLPVLVAVDTVLSLGVVPQGGVAYYFDPTCLTAVTQLVVPTGSARGTFYFKSNVTGMFDATASAVGLPTVSQTQTVVQAPVTQLAFTNGVQSVGAGLCSGQLTVQTRDATGVMAPLIAGGSIALSSNQAGVAFFTDATCTTALMNDSLTVAPGGSGGSFFVRATSTQATTLTATLAAVTPATQVLMVIPALPAQLVFATGPQGLQSNVCSTLVRVETRDLLNNLSPVSAATTVDLMSSGVAIQLFSDSNCTTPLTTPMSLAANGSSVAFHFRGTTVGMATLTASSAGLTSAMQTHSIGVGPPSKLVLSAAQTIVAGQCSAAATVEVQDSNSNPSNVVGTALSVSFSGSAIGPAFYSDSSCNTAITGLDIPVGGTSGTFYLRGVNAGMYPMTASAGGLSPAMRTHTVSPAPPSVLAFTTPVQSVAAGVCAQFDLEARDTFGNPSPTAAVSVVLTSSPAVTFSTAAGCAASATSVNLVGTVATFYASSNVAGMRTLTATAPFGIATQAFTVTPGTATKLGFVVQPTNATAGAAIAPSVQVAIQDAVGNTLTTSTANVTLAIGTNPGTGVLSGTLTVAAVAGIATFPGVSINRSGVGYTLSASSTGLTAATSTAFTIAAGAASALQFTVQPTTATAGVAIAPAVQVAIHDALGNTVSSTANVSIAIGNNPSAGVLAGTTTVAAVAGVATFSNLAINRTGTGYTLSATSGALPAETSTAFNINTGPAARLTFTVQPSNEVAGASITPAVQVRIEDSQGNPITGSTANVSLALGINPSSATLSGTTTVAAVAGVATFSNLSLNRTGTNFTLVATSAGLTSATSAPFAITPGAATQVSFLVQPGTTVAGATIDPAPRVEVLDALGNRVTTSTASITVAIGTNPGGGALSGTATVSATAGLATFAGLSINRTGTGYTLAASSAGLTGDISNAFNITPGAAAKLAFAVQPTNAVSTVTFAPAVQVTVQDALNNTVTGSTASIVLAIANNPNGGILSGAVTVAAVAGVATFSTVSIDKVGTQYTLGATSAGLAATTSAGFNITVGAPVRLVILGSPLTVPALGCSAIRTVELQDAGGNPAPSVGATVLSYASSVAGMTFYSDPACATASTPASRTIGNGATTVAFYFSALNAAPNLLITVSGGGFINGTQGATISAALPTQLVFTTPPPTLEAGACQALVLERQDSADRPTSPTFATTVTRTSLPATGISFFTDATCTNALGATFDILASASSATIFVKGISGSLTGTTPGAQNYGVTASAGGLTNGTINVTVLPMVRRGTCNFANGNFNVTCDVLPAIPGDVISRTFLMFQAAGTATNPADSNVTCRLTNTAGVDVVCDRGGNSGALTVQWETASFAQSFAAGGVTVEHLMGSFTGATANPINATVTSVDLTKSFLLFSTATVGGANGADDFLTARLTTATNVAITQSQSATYSNIGRYGLQVVSFAGTNVVRGNEAALQVATVPVTGLAAVTLSRTFALMTARTSTTNDDNAMCKRKLRGVVSSTTGLTFTRGDGAAGACIDAELPEVAWERIELPATHLVQSVNVTHASNASTGNAGLTTSVDLTRSLVFMAGQGPGGQAAGESNFSSNDVVAAVTGLPVLDAAGATVTVTRAANNLGTATFTPFVVQFAP